MRTQGSVEHLTTGCQSVSQAHPLSQRRKYCNCPCGVSSATYATRTLLDSIPKGFINLLPLTENYFGALPPADIIGIIMLFPLNLLFSHLMTLKSNRSLITRLRNTSCGQFSVQFMNILEFRLVVLSNFATPNSSYHATLCSALPPL